MKMIVTWSCFVGLLLSVLCVSSVQCSDAATDLPLSLNARGRLAVIKTLKKELAVAELAAVGTLLEEFSEEYRYYPGVQGRLDEISVVLAPVYRSTALQELPRLDPWGREYRLRTVGTGYLIVSLGPDRSLNSDYDALVDGGAWGSMCSNGDDLVFRNGSMCP